MAKVIWKRKENKQIVNRNPKKTIINTKNLTKIFGSKVFRILTGFIIVASISIFLTNLLTNKIFTIQQYEVYGAKQISEEEILDNVEKFQNKNFFRTSPNDVEKQINSSSIFLKDVYVEKAFPNKIVVYLVERFPEAVFINLSGAYLIDQEKVVVKVLAKTDAQDMTNEERELLAGRLKIENDLVKNFLTKDMKEDEKKKFDFKNYTDKRKQDVYNQLKSELINKLDGLLEQNSKGVSTTEFANLDRIFYYSNNSFQEGSKIDEKFTKIPANISAYIKTQDELSIRRIIWKDDFTISVTTSNGKEFIFSDRRDIFVQLEELSEMINYLALRKISYRIIDVTSSVISVR